MEWTTVFASWNSVIASGALSMVGRGLRFESVRGLYKGLE
jgi:hypothetical protein